LPSHKNGLKATLLEAIDEGLQNVLGKSGKELIYHQLLKKYGLKKEKIPEKPEVLAELLNTLFGYGAKIIENEIVNSINKKQGNKKYVKKNTRLTEYLKKNNIFI
jgi:hypothetical protein